jgi:hypothetical protein
VFPAAEEGGGEGVQASEGGGYPQGLKGNREGECVDKGKNEWFREREERCEGLVSCGKRKEGY